MKRPAIFFDRDNTLIVADGYLGDPDKIVLAPGAADAVARARSLGFATVVFSNQSGVGRGLYSEEDVHACNDRMDQLLQKQNPAAVIDRHEFCPYHPDATIEDYRRETELRKPGPGMIIEAAKALALDVERSWAVGDSPRDIESGKAAGCRTVLVRDPQLTPSPAALEALQSQPNAIVSNLREAMDYIDQQVNGTAVKTSPVQTAAPVTKAVEPQLVEPAPMPSMTRMEMLAEQILSELKRRNEPLADFSVSKLLAGIVQVIALAVMFLAYLNRGTAGVDSTIFVAIYLQALTVALLLMSRP